MFKHPSTTSLALATVLLLALGACGAPTTDAPGTTEPPPTTTPPTTTAPVPTTTAPPATTSTTGPSSVLDEAEGSGCTPGPGALPDGEWFGYASDVEDGGFEFDLACWFTGDAAARAATEDGEESPPPNDYYVRNQNSAERSLEISGDTEVVWYPEPGDPNSEATATYDEWMAASGGRSFIPAVWVEIQDGVVVRIHEQWVP